MDLVAAGSADSTREDVVVFEAHGERIKQTVRVDAETGLDINEITGLLQTRDETLRTAQEVYEVGRVALGPELDRYNEWLKKNEDKERKLFGKAPAVPGTTQAQREQRPPPSQPSAQHAAPAVSSGVENLSDIADARKAEGNAALQRGDLRRAVALYTEAINIDDGVDVYWSNRAEAQLRLRRYTDALHDARRARALNPSNEKAAFREVSALKALRRIDEARATATAAAAAFPARAATWEPLCRELDAAPVLLLEPVTAQAATSPAFVPGHCAVRTVTAGTAHASGGVLLGALPALVWRPSALCEAMPCVFTSQPVRAWVDRDAATAYAVECMAAVLLRVDALAAGADAAAGARLVQEVLGYARVANRRYHLASYEAAAAHDLPFDLAEAADDIARAVVASGAYAAGTAAVVRAAVAGTASSTPSADEAEQAVAELCAAVAAVCYGLHANGSADGRALVLQRVFLSRRLNPAALRALSTSDSVDAAHVHRVELILPSPSADGVVAAASADVVSLHSPTCVPCWLEERPAAGCADDAQSPRSTARDHWYGLQA